MNNSYKELYDVINKRKDTFRQPEGQSSSYPGYKYIGYTTKTSLVDSIFNRIAIDVSMITFDHVLYTHDTDNNVSTETKINSRMLQCLTLKANIDQTGSQFIQDVVQTMFEEGVVAIVPTVTDSRITDDGMFDIVEVRVGRIVQWYPRDVKVSVYNDRVGKVENITLSKTEVAIVENPFYSTINSDNATLKRLIRKLNLLDSVDNTINSQKLDLIVQLPYVIKTDRRKEEANARLKSITEQLDANKFGIAYIDGSEKITQLNRPVTNNLLTEVEYLTNELFNQLGLTKNIFNGTADERESKSYYSRTINPIAKAIVDSMMGSFLTVESYNEGERIIFYKNPFDLVTLSELADAADKFGRNEIIRPNEVRRIAGLPSDPNPKSNMLVNRNMAPTMDLEKNQNEEEINVKEEI